MGQRKGFGKAEFSYKERCIGDRWLEPVTAGAMTGPRLSGDSRSVLLGSQRVAPFSVVDSLNIHAPTNFGDPRGQPTIQPMVKCTVRDIVILKPTLKRPHVLLVTNFSC